ncbi:glutamate racemase [Thermanaerothrix sp. 4228-RoL]|uniref:Glutamate racemase n=2 Tax=Thermanaerothrix TaxID=1077886 RepID=A0ABU3NPP6_9CHLR|nr:glutamate racemase [Thermanaerothrix sp. 4228-RoL]MDT8898801.1 glutamate racemase [Thermanaerothrix sp. 4228-RoL]
MDTTAEAVAIGIFDSGVGGLSVLRAIRALLPQHPVIYLADQAHVPYGPRSLEEVRGFAEGITRFLLRHGARVIVVACNTASAAALYHLRTMYPDVPFVGMEPAVKPAAEQTQTGRVGVLATPATFQGALYASVVERFASHVRLYQDTCPGLVEAIEAGDLNGETPRQILERALRPMLAEGIDTVVLGCTHYPFVIPLIQEITGAEVRVIDPAPAVARQTQRVLDQRGWLTPLGRAGKVRFFTSGEVERLRMQVQRLLGEREVTVEKVVWSGGEVRLMSSVTISTS